MNLKQYRELKLKEAKKAAELALEEYKDALEGPYGGSKLPNSLPVGRVTGQLRRNASLVGDSPEWSIINRSIYWQYIRDGRAGLKGRGRAICQRIINRIRGNYK